MRLKWKSRMSKLLVFVLVWGMFTGLLNSNANAEEAAVMDVQSPSSSSSAISWNEIAILGTSATGGWNSYQLGQLQLTNDHDNLYFRVTGVKVEDWQNINIALNINGQDSGQSDNPLHQQYRFNGPSRPQYQIVLDAGSKLSKNQIGLYASSQLDAPLLSAANPQGADFRGNAQSGFEGSIPLSVLGLKNGDQLRGAVILSGDNANEHGAFDIIPESPANTIATDWNMKPSPNVISEYSNSYMVALNHSPIVDGNRDSVWEAVYTLGDSSTLNEIGLKSEIHNFKMTNDSRNLYFWLDAKVPNWAEYGQMIDIALQVNGEDSGIGVNPISAPYNFNAAQVKPQYHITIRVKNDNEVQEAALYASNDFAHPIAKYGANSNGAMFALDRNQGFEASIPLKLLGLKNGDQLRSIVVLTGNNNVEHGAFNVIPEHPLNQLASTWNEQHQPNTQQVYTEPYTITGFSGKLDVVNSSPVNHEAKAPNDGKITVIWTENIRVLQPDGMQLLDQDGQVVPAELTAVKNQLQLQSNAKLQYGHTYKVLVAADAVEGQDTSTRNPSYAFSFTTKTRPSMKQAFVDHPDKVKVILNEVIPNLKYSQFAIFNGGVKLNGTASQGAKSDEVVIQLQDKITNVADPYVVRYEDAGADGYADQPLTMRSILDTYVYDGNDLGVTYQAAASTFKVWAPTAKQVTVLLYDNPAAAQDEPTSTRELTRDEQSGVWSQTVQGNLEGKYYMYLVEFASGLKTYALDPYAKASAVNSAKSAIVNLAATDPAGWNPDIKPPMVEPTDAVLYELHTRDFSMDENSGISANHRGKFMAFTETGTTIPGRPDVSTGIDHLKELGITHVHLLPFYDFGSVNERKVDDLTAPERKFNWGYDPVNYNVPEGSYATNSSDEDPARRITEMKSMVQALHNNGIRIVLDVVYNHTYTTGLTSEFSVFDKIVPGYFYRSDERGEFTNGSGVGNEVASERPMVSKYIKDSVKYLAEEYNVDGFRFDLMALIDINTMTSLTKELKQADPSMIIYGEPWSGGTSALPSELLTVKGKQRGTGFAVFNDNIRGAIKGGSDDDSTGFATGASGQEEAIIRGVEGSTSEITDNPPETINYVTAHDNLNLWDKVLKTQHKDGQIKTDPFVTLTEANVLDNEMVKRSLLANGIIFTSQGIPFMHAGDEMLRSKFGDHNSYASSDEINQIRWEQKAKYKPVFDYVQGLIELRKTHPAFRMTTKQAVAANLQVIQKKDNIVAFQLKNYANQDPWNNIVVIYNANMNAKEVTLPSSAAWKVVVDHTAAGIDTIRTVSGNKVQVEGLSMMVLYDQAIDYVPVPTTIEVTPHLMGLEKGMSRVAATVVKDQKGNKMQGQAVTWSTSDEQVATVTLAGKVTAKGNGKAVITASLGQIQGSVTVEVTTLVPTSITVSGMEQLYTSRSVALSAEVKDQYDAEMIGAAVAWSSSNPSVATVDRAGKVTGLSAGTVTITAKAGNASAQKKLTVKPLVKRYIQLNYVRPQGDFTDWAVWVWDTGAQNGKIEFNTKKGNTAMVNIEIGPDTERIGFIIYRGEWAEKDPSTDRFITTNLNDTVTKVTSYSGQVEMKVAPSVTGPMLENGNITFVYRDDEIFLQGGLDRITKMQVTVNGTAYKMTYDAEHERFIYTLENVASGNYTYTFTMTKDGKTTTFNDPKNEVDGQSVVAYSKPKVTVTASVEPNTIHAGQNRVMSVQLKADSKVEYREIYADLTSLGGSNHVQIDPQLLEQTIAVEDHVPTGMMTISITAVDSFGNKHQGTTQVQVVTKPKGMGALDFEWDEARIYFALTDRFSDGDPSNNGVAGQDYKKDHPEAYHGGDFRGLINKLDYLQSLGVNTLWITPIVDNIEFNKGVDFGSSQYAYHGYWAKDFEKLDEHLGDLDTFKELINKAHDRGIKLMVDVVLNHTGYGLKPDDDRPGITEADKARFAGMLRTDGVSANEQVIRGEVEGLPDFKTEEEAVRNQVIHWQTDWLERAKTDRGDTIDYYRVDTVKHVDDTTWKAFKNKLTTINPNFKLIGEYYGGNADNMGTYLNSGEMDSLLDFGFKDLALDFVNGRLDQVEQKLQARDAKINNTATLGQFLSSHDEDGFLSEKIGGDRGKLMVAAALQVTAKGQPVIYYGEELGRSGKNAGNMGEGKFSFNRTDMPWEKLMEEKFLHDHYAKLLQIRSNYSKVISKGSRSKIAGGDTEKYLVFDKMYQGKHLVIGLNTDRAAKEQITLKVPFDAGKVVIDEYSGQSYTVNPQQVITLTLPGRDQGGTVILAEKDPTNPEQPEPPTSKPSESTSTPATSVSESGVERTTQGVVITPSKTMQVTDADGMKLVQTTLSNNQVVKGLQMVASTTNEHTLIVQLKEAANARIVIPNVTVQSILQALTSDPQLKVIIQSANIRYELPIRGLDWTGIVKAMQQAKPQDVSLVVLLREAPDAASNAFKDAAARIGAVAAGPLMEMAVFAQTEGQTLELHDFGSIYTMRELTLKGEFDAKHTSAVRFDPISKQLSFVPALFKKDAQHTQVTMQRNGSSLYGMITFNKQFTDLKGHWAAKEIELLASKLIVNGDADGRFTPSRHVTRAEFTAMLVRALGLTQSSSSESRFTDVDSHAWYTDVIHTAVEAKLVRGFEDGSFQPDALVTREQMAQMIVNALHYVQPENMPEGGSLNAYRDQYQISDWAKTAFAIGHHTQILNGFEDQTLRPNAAASRAESVVMLKHMLTYLKFIS